MIWKNNISFTNVVKYDNNELRYLKHNDSDLWSDFEDTPTTDTYIRARVYAEETGENITTACTITINGVGGNIQKLASGTSYTVHFEIPLGLGYDAPEDVTGVTDAEPIIDIKALAPAHISHFTYFTLKALEDGSTVKLPSTLQYSTDGGSTWATGNGGTRTLSKGQEVWYKSTNNQVSGGTFSGMTTGKLQVGGNIMSLTYGDNYEGQKTLKTGYTFHKLFSNSTSIVDAGDLELPATALTNYAYYGMFNQCSGLTQAPKVIEAKTVGQQSCFWMFNLCTALQKAPELAFESIGTSGCTYMFSGCSTMTQAPSVIPATSVGNRGCTGMFYGCSGITAAPQMSAQTCDSYSFSGMFHNCVSMETPPDIIPASAMTGYGCCQSMFYNCHSLKRAPRIMALTLGSGTFQQMYGNCYALTDVPDFVCTAATSGYSMLQTFINCRSLVKAPQIPLVSMGGSQALRQTFAGCTSLTEAPEFRAETLTTDCYNGMFSGCTSLERAPKLPARILVSGCYNYMFQGCSKLKYIEAVFTTTPTSANCLNWVDGVASGGHFVKNNTASWYVISTNGVPAGWSTGKTRNYFYLEALADNTSVLLPSKLQYSTDSGTSWTTGSGSYRTISTGTKIMFRSPSTVTQISGTTFYGGSGKLKAGGNIMSLLWSNDYEGRLSFSGTAGYQFLELFRGCTTLVDASELELPAISASIRSYGAMFSDCTNLESAPRILPAFNVGERAYNEMFYRCTKLTKAPEIQAVTLGQTAMNNMFFSCTSLKDAPSTLSASTLNSNCYQYMFQNCTGLTKAPQLPATNLANNCYYSMFIRCNSLTDAPELPATTLKSGCYNTMFSGCTSLTGAPALPATTANASCYAYMFYGCTSLQQAPELPATTVAGNCYTAMFSGCTSLTGAPALPATTLVSNCYYSMFDGCTSLLTTAPELPATNLASNCYYRMFYGCSSLQRAPKLPALSIAYGACYQEMFMNCTSLNHIDARFTTTPSASYTSNWVAGVAPTGTFVKNAAATWDVVGANGIPEGWTVETA